MRKGQEGEGERNFGWKELMMGKQDGEMYNQGVCKSMKLRIGIREGQKKK